MKTFFDQVKKEYIRQILYENREKLNSEGINWKEWYGRFRYIWNRTPDLGVEIAEEFATQKICHISGIINDSIEESIRPILFCVIRNDIEKIRLFIEHYRKMGVRQFVFLDNNSSDGTFEFLMKQEDVILYRVYHSFRSDWKVAWINWMLAKHGKNRWCLVVDSDELIRFIYDEDHSICDLINAAETKGVRRIEGFMLDMYPDGDILKYNYNEKEWIRDYAFFDKDSYRIKRMDIGLAVFGGPRDRAICRDNDFKFLSKCPLFKFGKKEIYASSHYMLPAVVEGKFPMWISICHYKFVGEKDIKKLKEAVVKKQYAGDSHLYRLWMSEIKRRNELVLFDANHSVELVSSKSLIDLSLISSPFR